MRVVILLLVICIFARNAVMAERIYDVAFCAKENAEKAHTEVDVLKSENLRCAQNTSWFFMKKKTKVKSRMCSDS